MDSAVNDGLVLIEYVGGNYGTMTWWVGRRRYLFSAGKPRQYVPAADAKELLQERQNTKPVFRKVALREAKPRKTPPPVDVSKKEPETQPAPASAATQKAPAEIWPEIDATPKAFELAHELEVDLATVLGTGAGGRILVRDVRDAAAAGLE
jgi:pyruvate/2-oxoglutarate dehydrogenase complex dihydrolipoamide acyltransferase (E2) component